MAPVQSTALPAPTAAAPTVPAAPPAPAVGLGLRPATPAGPAAAAGTPPRAPAVAGPAADRVVVAFVPGNATVPPAALPGLRALAARRGSRAIAVLGQGDAATAGPTAQLAAVKLGLARAEAIAAALRDAGVPGSAIRLHAEASGQEGIARLE